MTRSHREMHRKTMFMAAVVLPIVFTLGIALRRPVASLTASGESVIELAGSVVWSSYDLWPAQKIATQVRRNSDGKIAVELSWRELVKPDLLLYWAPGKTNRLTELPENCRFLGAVRAGLPIAVPEEIRGNQGMLMLYSLADHEIIALSNSFVMQKR